MAFMELFTYGPMTGVIVETTGGNYVFPSFVWDDFPNKTDLVGSDHITKIENVRGFFGRYSAPGYLDCTEWLYDEDVAALEKELRETYGGDEPNECADCFGYGKYPVMTATEISVPADAVTCKTCDGSGTIEAETN